MCGFFATNRPALSENEFRLLDNLLESRGPDSQLTHAEHNFLCKHYRLITRGSPSTGVQPVITDDYIILFNGNIYNSRSLAREFGVEYSGSDTDVLVSLFIKVGTSIFSLLDGFFAICIYNRHTQEWILTRSSRH